MIVRTLAFALALAFGIGPIAAEENIANTPRSRVVSPQHPPASMRLAVDSTSCSADLANPKTGVIQSCTCPGNQTCVSYVYTCACK
jgi:hypothetical protein